MDSVYIEMSTKTIQKHWYHLCINKREIQYER